MSRRSSRTLRMPGVGAPCDRLTISVQKLLVMELPVKRHRGEPGHTRGTQDTRAQTGTRITQTNLTTIQTQRHTRTTTRRPKPRPGQQPQERPQARSRAWNYRYCTVLLEFLLGFRARYRLEFRSETGFLSTFTAQSVRIFFEHQMNSVFL